MLNHCGKRTKYFTIETKPEDNQSHLSSSEREGNLEESHLIPDVQVDGVVFKKKYQQLALVEPNIVLLL